MPHPQLPSRFGPTPNPVDPSDSANANLFRMQRANRLREDAETYIKEIGSLHNQMQMGMSQWLELAHLHQFSYIDPLRADSMPFPDKVQTDMAAKLHRAAIAALVLGIIVAVTLSVRGMQGDRILILISATLIALLISSVMVAVMWRSVEADPRNPQAARKIKPWVLAFGFIVILSVLAFGTLRFASGLLSGDFSLTILALFEIGVFGLTACFECERRIYKWSQEIFDEYGRLKATKGDLEKKLVTINVELAELEKNFKINALESQKNVPDKPCSDQVARQNEPLESQENLSTPQKEYLHTLSGSIQVIFKEDVES